MALEDIESQSKDKVEKEQEVTIYAEMSEPSGLAQAYDQEEHIQAEIKVDETHRIRVRKTTKKEGTPTYHMTSKVTISNEEGLRVFDEQTSEISEEAFDVFMKVVDKYQKKARYYFKVEKLVISEGGENNSLEVDDFKYEVDVFTNNAGKQSTWCKIDLEIQDLQEKIKEAGINTDKFNLTVGAGSLPFKPTNFIIMDKYTSEEDITKVTELYNTQFLISDRETAETEEVTSETPTEEVKAEIEEAPQEPVEETTEEPTEEVTEEPTGSEEEAE